jgi:hypothetical protein
VPVSRVASETSKASPKQERRNSLNSVTTGGEKENFNLCFFLLVVSFFLLVVSPFSLLA